MGEFLDGVFRQRGRERVAIIKKIQQMEVSFTRFVREILAPVVN